MRLTANIQANCSTVNAIDIGADRAVTSLWSPSICHHVVGQSMFGMWSKTDVPSKAVSKRSNRLASLDLELRLQILQQVRTIR